ncbi:MAG: PAS domain S-box protein, partial [Deltaproteobacteria bacterium]|nr:PAS domain S-box protein [Deltaproteobacteria bacterium]
MAKKPTYEELEQRVSELKKEVSELKQTKEVLEQSEEKYRGLVENSFDGIFVQKGSKIIFTNQRLNEMLGYDEGELVGFNHWRLYHPDYQELTRERAEARMRGETVTSQYEVKLQRKDGLWFYGEINARSISLEEEHGIQVWVRDITERKRSEEELKTRQTYLESVLYSAPDAIVTLDASHQVIEWNIGAEQIFGYTRHEAVGKNLDDLVTGPEVIDESKAFTLQVLSGSKIHPRETMRYRKDGTPVNVIVAGSPIIIRDELQGVVAVYTDITDRKKAEEEVKESEEKYRTILQSIEDGYYELDIAGNFTFFNDSMCKTFGYTNDELMGMNNREYTEKETAKRLYQTFNRVYETGKPTKIFDFEIIRKDTTKRYVEASVSLIKDTEGQRKGFRGIVRDITEKKNLEAQ